MLCERLRELRRSRGLTQAQLAKELGISASAIGMYEQGRREPDYRVLQQICQYFQVSSDFFLTPGSRKEQTDLNDVIDKVRDLILSQDGLMFNGVLLDKEDGQKIVDAIQLGIQFVMQQKKT